MVERASLSHSVFSDSIRGTRVDLPRLIVAFLAINFLPALALWRYNAIHEWLQRNRKKVIIFACLLVILFLLMVGSAVYEQVRRVQQTSSKKGAAVVNPSPARVVRPDEIPAVSNVGPTSEGLPPGFVWETTPAPGATPTPVRRAIEQ